MVAVLGIAALLAATFALLDVGAGDRLRLVILAWKGPGGDLVSLWLALEMAKVVLGAWLAYRLLFATQAGEDLAHQFGLPRVLIVAFLMVLFAIGWRNGVDLSRLASDSLVRTGQSLVLVLALVPMVEGGLGLNFGLPVGIVCGLFGITLSLELGTRPLPVLDRLLGLELYAPMLSQGLAGLAFAMAAGGALAIVAGWLYGRLLNRVRGDEMMVGTYVGFAVVAAAKIFWIVAPFRSPELIWSIGGSGVRTTLSLSGHYAKALDDSLAFVLSPLADPGARLVVPTGSLVFGLCVASLLWVFFRTPWGLAIRAAGANPLFARACGIDDERTRVGATILSTVLAAVGIVVYAQSLRFAQLYDAPLMMAFPAVACLLIGGGSVARVSVGQVLLGTLLFQTLLTIALPITSTVFPGDISEVMRLIITNGMILYALTRGTGR